MTAARLANIRRQRLAPLRQVVELLAEERTDNAVELLAAQGRVQEVADAKTRYERIAADVVKSFAARQNTLVVSPANAERKVLNTTIRKALVEDGYVRKRGQQQNTLVRKDLSEKQLQSAQSYEQGDVLHFSVGSRWLGIRKDSYLTVRAVDRERNLVAVGNRWLPVRINPERCYGIQAYTQEQRTFAKVDRVQFRAHDKEHESANEAFATIVRLNARRAKLRFDEGGKQWFKLSELRHVDYGYCSTSHSAQGATVDCVIVNIDSSNGENLVNRTQFYVSTSRARDDVQA